MGPILVTLAAMSALGFAQTAPDWQQPLTQQKWSEAERLLKQALAEDETAPVLNGLVQVYRATGRIQEADPILERLVVLEESPANVEDLARTKAALGNLDRAEMLYRRALELRGSDDLAGVIPVHQRLAQVLRGEQKYDEAEQQALVAMAYRIRTTGPKSPELAADNAVLARIYETEMKWDLAANVWDNVAATQTETLGWDSIRIAETLDSLAVCRYQLHAFDQAELALRRALAIRELNLGPVSAEVGNTADQLGMLFYHLKRYSDAEPFYRKALDIFSMLHPDDALLARSYDNLAVTEAMLEKYAEVEVLYRAALKLRDGDDAIGLHDLALILVQRGKAAEAEPLYGRLVTILDAPGNANPDLQPQVLTEYASLLRDLKRPVEAGKLESRLKGKQTMASKQAPSAAKQSTKD